jgi:hypothetical protein
MEMFIDEEEEWQQQGQCVTCAECVISSCIVNFLFDFLWHGGK